MKFVLVMARRELRSSWRRLLFFFLSIAVGVGCIVAVRSMMQNANAAIASEARALLTADVQVDTNRPWEKEALDKINRIAAPLATGRTETIDSATMIRPADPQRPGAMMIELKGVEPQFPLYGEFKLQDGEPFNYALLTEHGAIVAPALLERLSLKAGDEVFIGATKFQIRGVLDKEPGGTSGFRLGPRVFIERAALESAGLTGFGSRARRRILFSTPEGKMDSLVKQLRAEFKNDNFVNVRSYKTSQENLTEQFARAEDYSSLTGLVILVLGGIGILNVTRTFIEQKKKSIAVLKCLGGSGTRITLVYLLQVVLLGITGSLLGVAFGKGVLMVIERFFADRLPQYMTYGLRPGAALQGFAVGLLISLLFSALPLLRIRHIKPNVLLREDVAPAARRFDWGRWGLASVIIVGLLLLVSWQAGSIRVGLIFLGGLIVTAGLLYGAATLLIWLVRRVGRVRSFPLKQAINSLHRPGNQTRITVMVVGLGVFLVVSIQAVQANLVNEFNATLQGNLPNMFLIDVQTDQARPLAEFVEQQTGEPAEMVPTVRARIQAINGEAVDFEKEEMKRERGRLGREYVVTYRPNLDTNETVIGGKFWDASPSKEAEVSIEENMRGLSGLDVGSDITFDIQGRKITARVTSVRRVEWRNSRTGFMFVFRPGVLESAPQMWVAAINGPEAEPARSRFQRALVDKYPNVSVIDVGDILKAVTRIVNNITLAVTFVGAFVLLSGALILTGSLAMTKFQRVYETAVLKTLGAKRKTILLMLLAEYGLMGTVAGVVGSLAAIGLSYATSHYVFEIKWSPTLQINLIGIAATILLVTVVGAASTLDVLARKPLATLRAQ
ncbi:MAG TPA: FtsX-like permease family protein [Blastocatellia bacterium]|nr:FtsX-like permease family protein [Blastocatellia bacterium]